MARDDGAGAARTAAGGRARPRSLREALPRTALLESAGPRVELLHAPKVPLHAPRWRIQLNAAHGRSGNVEPDSGEQDEVTGGCPAAGVGALYVISRERPFSTTAIDTGD